MWIHEDQVLALQADKVNGLTRSTAHGPHSDVLLPKDITYGLDIARLYPCHADSRGYNHQAAVLEGLAGLLEDSEVPVGLCLVVDLVEEEDLLCALLLVLVDHVLILIGLREVFGFVCHVDFLVHFQANLFEEDISIVQHANLEIVAEGSKQSIERAHDVSHLSNSQPVAWEDVLGDECHLCHVVKPERLYWF